MKQNDRRVRQLTKSFAGGSMSHGIRLAYLLGSRASGGFGPESDYDVAVLFDEPPVPEVVYAMKHRLSEVLQTEKIDLVPLNRAPITLQYNVVAAGALLYRASAVSQVEFEARTLVLYFDQLPVLRRQRAELLDEDDYETGIQRYRAAIRKTEKLLAEIGAS